MIKRVYLGAGVTVEYVDGALLKLTTTNDMSGTTNTIWLEWDTYSALVEFVAALQAHAIQQDRVTHDD